MSLIPFLTCIMRTRAIRGAKLLLLVERMKSGLKNIAILMCIALFFRNFAVENKYLLPFDLTCIIHAGASKS